MYAKVESLGLNGLDAFSVTVEADISTGLPRFDSLYTNDVVSASYQGLPVWLAWLKLCEMALYLDPETEMEKEEER